MVQLPAYCRPAHSIGLTVLRDHISSSYKPICSNFFGDIFLLGSDGSVHMFDLSLFELKKIAESWADFLVDCEADEESWIGAALVDLCVQAGLKVQAHQCYAFKIPPILGGQYSLDNIRVASVDEWYAVCCDLQNQIRHLPDGSTIEIKTVD